MLPDRTQWREEDDHYHERGELLHLDLPSCCCAINSRGVLTGTEDFKRLNW
jgi:hypothetical protein